MATLIPSLNSCLPKMTSGEKRLARRLESHLEDDYSCWFDIPLGGRQKYSDFIVLHPARGLLLLEVKDWKLDTIRSVDRASVELLT
ncbi:MAG: nuclease-related domain-containing protein, partial [Gimesia chilikensis]